MSSSRQGILAGGNFIVDYVKIIDDYPQQDMLASILSESQSNGGGPYNVLKDLAAMQATFPLAAAGLVGKDSNGNWILQDCTSHGIDVTQLRQTAEESTSYTDAMTSQRSGRRTFFHRRGANALLDADDIDFTQSQSRIFHLGYLMLLDKLDSFDESVRTRASLLLEKAQAEGFITTVDMVSTEHPKFREIALSALPYTDYLLLNEAEASRTIHRDVVADNPQSLLSACKDLINEGVLKGVVLHTVHGAAACLRNGSEAVQASLKLPADFSKGATGAGDAFAAGFLYALHEGWPLEQQLRLAVCTAAMSLTHPTPSGGLKSVKECLALADQFPFAAWAIS